MRAWTCHGRNQRDLVDRLRQAGIVSTPAVQSVLEAVDRANYISSYKHTTNTAYMDRPQGIGLEQTISAPHMHAHALEEIYPSLVGKDDIKLLDVGCGSGYLTATLGRWLQVKPKKNPSSNTNTNTNTNGKGGEEREEEEEEDCCILGPLVMGKVFGIDVHEGLIDLTTQNMRREDGDLLDTGLVQIQLRDGWKGMPEEAPFDAIHVGAAAESMPYELIQQLKVGGVMIIPVGLQSDIQHLYKIERIRRYHQEATIDSSTFVPADYEITTLLSVRYVPLVHPPTGLL